MTVWRSIQELHGRWRSRDGYKIAKFRAWNFSSNLNFDDVVQTKRKLQPFSSHACGRPWLHVSLCPLSLSLSLSLSPKCQGCWWAQLVLLIPKMRTQKYATALLPMFLTFFFWRLAVSFVFLFQFASLASFLNLRSTMQNNQQILSLKYWSAFISQLWNLLQTYITFL